MHSRLGVALDMGTSGFRAQAVELPSGKVLATVITLAHPLPGANVIDHLHFALETGVGKAQEIILGAVDNLIKALGVPTEHIGCLGVCGNPVQLSLFQGMEIRDLVYAGSAKLETLKISPPDRTGSVIKASTTEVLRVGRDCEIIIPPAVHHTVGADALALILHSGMLETEQTALATDYGTNAEMALYHEGRIFTASAAAGPALEGQQIECGMLAAPGALVDLIRTNLGYQCIVLDEELLPVAGTLVKFHHQDGSGAATSCIKGIAGTGAIAVIEQAMEAGVIDLPAISTADKRVYLDRGIYFSQQDLHEAGKAIGAIRAGHLTLCHEAGISSADVAVTYMGGASGTYVDAVKAQKLGLLPPRVATISQVGNTSLKMARELVTDRSALEKMNVLADRIRAGHRMLATSEIFKKIFILELSRWTEGLPVDMYKKLLGRYGINDELPEIIPAVTIHRVKRDIDDLGVLGVTLLDPDWEIHRHFVGCTECMACVQECPQRALAIDSESGMILVVSRCNGVACRRCEQICPEKVFFLNEFFAQSEQM